MAFCKINFIVSYISIVYLVDIVSALSKEAIVGGTPAPPLIFTYHVSIQGIQNNTVEYTQFGSGAIVSDNHVVSVANAFLQSDGQLKDRRFSIVAGSIDLNSPQAFRIDIMSVFLPTFDPEFLMFNIAVAKLEKRLGIGETPFVNKVKLPNAGDVFDKLEALVSGYGLVEIAKEVNTLSGSATMMKGVLSPILSFRNVIILSDDDCIKNYPAQISVTNLCGKMLRRHVDEIAGVCFGDSGNPLVKDGVLVGIVSMLTPDCDNTNIGALYMKVSSFVYNIQNFVDGIVPHDAFIRFNRVYVPPMFSTY